MSQHAASLSTYLLKVSLAAADKTSDHSSICLFVSVSTLPSVNTLEYQVRSAVVRLDFSLRVLNRKYYRYTGSLAAGTTSGRWTQDAQQMGPSSAEVVGVQRGTLRPHLCGLESARTDICQCPQTGDAKPSQGTEICMKIECYVLNKRWERGGVDN